MTDQDMEIWKRGYDIHEKYHGRKMTISDWTELSDDCRNLYNDYKTPFAMHMATMMLDLFMDLSQKVAG